MQIPVEITFKELESSDALKARVHEWVGKLEHICDRITRCEVLIETPNRHQRQGREFHIRVRVTVPGGELVASHDPGPDGSHEDVYVALRDTFLAVKRQLEDHVHTRQRRKTDHREAPAHARVSFVDVEREWGRIAGEDGREIYFHRNSVRGGMDGLKVGDEVRFTEEQGDQGPQASTVEVIGANGHHAMPVAG